MWSPISICLLVATAGHVHGIELSLTAVHEIDTCGKLRCVEDTTSNDDIIKRLTLRKQLDGDIVLVEMNQQLTFTNSRKNNATGVWAMGTLSSHRAEVQITLYNSEDCNNAEFLCEVVHLDKFGLEHVDSSSGRINGKFSGQQMKDLTSVVKMSASQCAANITQSFCLANLERKVDNLAESESKTLSKLEHIQETTTDLESKVEILIESNSKLLIKLETLANTKNEEKSVTCIKQHLTSCPKTLNRQHETPNRQHDCRYQVVYPPDGTPYYLCDTIGGWTVIQGRVDGKTDFHRNWFSYKHGFGSFDGDFWLGLEQIHKITSSSNQELMITIMYNGTLAYAHYDNFRVSGEEDNYKLSMGKYSGSAGDALRASNNKQFSVFDKDNDKRPTRHCGKEYQAGWWYTQAKHYYCSTTNLNGIWGATNKKGPIWYPFAHFNPLTMTEMKIRKMN